MILTSVQHLLHMRLKLYTVVLLLQQRRKHVLCLPMVCVSLFSMMIFTEEDMFKRSFAAALGMEEPQEPLPEDFQDPEEFQKASDKFIKAYEKFTAERDEKLRVTLDGGDIPPGVTGLIPDGSTKVSWRWMGEVFEESTDDILNNSIVVRNLQELGVDSIEALKYLFPGKTDEERAAMLSGYPFRMVQQTQQSINSFIGLLGNLISIATSTDA